MKNLLLSTLLVLLSFAGYSTSRGIEVVNRSGCDVYIQFRGSEKCPSCEIQYLSNMFVFPAMSTTPFPNTISLGGSFPVSTPAFVHSAIIYSGPRHCAQIQTWVIGDPSCYPPDVVFYSMTQNCEIRCQCLRARWVPAGCGGIARLIIDPC